LIEFSGALCRPEAAASPHVVTPLVVMNL